MEDTDPTNDTSSAPPPPLRGCIICCTSIADEKRTRLAEYVTAMGGLHRLDLTLEVTHLIVGDYDTPKYRYVAKERPDVSPMAVGWIEALRELWMHDQEIDMEKLERDHRLPTFTSLKFSMTGCDDPIERQEIADQVKKNGGVYEGDLTKRITHLLSFRTEGAKYKAARNWGLRIVSIEWFRDSLERGMILDEKLYDPVLPEKERGKGAWDRTKKARTFLGKRARADSAMSIEEGKRKLRRTTSTRLSNQSQDIWGDIVGSGRAAQVSRNGQLEITVRGDAHREDNDTDGTKKVLTAATAQLVADSKPSEKVFSGCRFYIYGFPPAKTQVLCGHLIPHGADIIKSEADLLAPLQSNSTDRLFMIVPHSLPVVEHPKLPQSDPIEIITEWWVERCLHHKKFMEPRDHVIGRPFPTFPLDKFGEMIISSAAFGGIDLLHVKKAVELLGGTYSEDLTPKSSVLVTNSLLALRKDKLEHAQQWNIPIVSGSWFWDSIDGGIRLPFNKYRFRAQKRLLEADSIKSDNRKFSKEAEVPSQEGENPTQSASASVNGSRSSMPTPAPPPNIGLDSTAFTNEEPIPVKTEPLSEINLNSSTKTMHMAPARIGHAMSKPQEDISIAITDLLAKTKTATTQPTPVESTERGRKRGTNRILGRATSNVSTTSTGLSRATSVDSTATSGQAVEYPQRATGSGQGASGQIEKFFQDKDNTTEKEEDLPPPTQLQYEDSESKEYAEIVMARMNGETLHQRTRASTKGESITLGGVAERPRERRSGRDRGKCSPKSPKDEHPSQISR
ncbi:hypothetical protein B7494_g1432 [Chlorociboria aeruginascens]|nr:hypothetical protein B7494_g1432 [Chlorociboria aeruginascens]